MRWQLIGTAESLPQRYIRIPSAVIVRHHHGRYGSADCCWSYHPTVLVEGGSRWPTAELQGFRRNERLLTCQGHSV
jgi:hypothetical protein